MFDLNLGLGAPNTDIHITPAVDKKPFFVVGSPLDMLVDEVADKVTFTAYLDERYGGAASSFKWFIENVEVQGGDMSPDGYTLWIESDIDLETNNLDEYRVEAIKTDALRTMSRTAILKFDTKPYQYNYQYNGQYA